MTLQRWDPYSQLRRIDHLMDHFWRGAGAAARPFAPEAWTVPVDVRHEGDDIVVSASLPGVSRDDIKVTIDDGVLTLRAETATEDEQKENGYVLRERRSGAFYRALRLPDTVDVDKVESRYENGVLTVTLPKSEASKARQVEVKAA